MKLEVEMYVRTKNGMIAKIISKEDVSGSLHREEVVFILDNGNKLALHSRKVIKASHNIIDLIEVGDYVNGEKVLLKNEGYIKVGTGMDYIVVNNEKFIKSIVTKEQISQMEYRIGE